MSSIFDIPPELLPGFCFSPVEVRELARTCRRLRERIPRDVFTHTRGFVNVIKSDWYTIIYCTEFRGSFIRSTCNFDDDLIPDIEHDYSLPIAVMHTSCHEMIGLKTRRLAVLFSIIDVRRLSYSRVLWQYYRFIGTPRSIIWDHTAGIPQYVMIRSGGGSVDIAGVPNYYQYYGAMKLAAQLGSAAIYVEGDEKITGVDTAAFVIECICG